MNVYVDECGGFMDHVSYILMTKICPLPQETIQPLFPLLINLVNESRYLNESDWEALLIIFIVFHHRFFQTMMAPYIRGSVWTSKGSLKGILHPKIKIVIFHLPPGSKMHTLFCISRATRVHCLCSNQSVTRRRSRIPVSSLGELYCHSATCGHTVERNVPHRTTVLHEYRHTRME